MIQDYLHASGMSTLATLVAISVPSAVTVCMLWQRWTERRSRSEIRGQLFLPTPRSLLPAWFGFLSGHTLLLEREKVRRKSLVIDCAWCHNCVS